MVRRMGMAAALAAALVAGCDSLPAPEAVRVAPPQGVALPMKARVMLYVPQGDLRRKMVIDQSLFRSAETDAQEGEAIEAAARRVLAQGFQTVATNDPSIRPQLVVKAIGKANWARIEGKLKVGCALDAFTADGASLGQHVGRFDSTVSMDYKGNLPAAYTLCMRQAAEALLAAPALKRQAAAGFPAPNPAAEDDFLRSLGFVRR